VCVSLQKRSEARAAQLLTRCKAAEAELEQYKVPASLADGTCVNCIVTRWLVSHAQAYMQSTMAAKQARRGSADARLK
jgi:hypothetical protein